MFKKIKKWSDYISLGATILFLISLFFNSWKVSGLLMLVIVLAVNTATYMQIQINNNPMSGVFDIAADLFQGQKKE